MAGNYVLELSIPAQTSETSPLETVFVLSTGIIDQISIGFPQGCYALAHLQIKEQESILFPSNPNASYAWNDTIYTFYPKHILSDQLPELTLVGWNLDDYHNHTITVFINISELPPMTDVMNSLLNAWGVL